MSEVVIQSLTITIPIGALFLGLYYFMSKQMTAMENRLRGDIQSMDTRLSGDIRDLDTRLSSDIRDSENRLRGEIAMVAESVETAKSELHGEIATAKSELRGEIAAVAKAVEKGGSDLNHRMDRMDDKVSRLIQDVGVVQGAVLGVSIEAGSREPAATS
ncbi:MAG: hypothetical protein F4Y49_01675 [Dehalococcoidia bacterium]|nr:hypothetical protein [Dehalococcoidia bacterium]